MPGANADANADHLGSFHPRARRLVAKPGMVPISVPTMAELARRTGRHRSRTVAMKREKFSARAARGSGPRRAGSAGDASEPMGLIYFDGLSCAQVSEVFE